VNYPPCTPVHLSTNAKPAVLPNPSYHVQARTRFCAVFAGPSDRHGRSTIRRARGTVELKYDVNEVRFWAGHRGLTLVLAAAGYRTAVADANGH
jgi:hypothetical protein